ncbi:MAG TPA: hypothetical protein VFV80_08485 [Geminicoccaceae bacterium]|nr:hypothetical protein [Geminicoccaceae bacterium]
MTALGLRPSGRLALSSRRRRGAAAPPESPDQISSLAFWYDAEASPTIEASGVIERWDDLSGNANHADQTVSSERPVKATDGQGRHVIRFDGIDDTLAVASPPDLAAGMTLFAVFAVRTRSDFSGVVSAAATTGVDHEAFFSLQNASAASEQFQWIGKSAGADPLLIGRDDNVTAGLAILTAAAGNALFEDLDGQGSDTYDGSFGRPDQIVLAGHYDEGTYGYSAIDVYEVGLYARALTAGERGVLQGYLRNKYGF